MKILKGEILRVKRRQEEMIANPSMNRGTGMAPADGVITSLRTDLQREMWANDMDAQREVIKQTEKIEEMETVVKTISMKKAGGAQWEHP